MIDLISYDFQPSVQFDMFYVILKYTDGSKEVCKVSSNMLDVLEKEEIVELLKGLHKD